MMSRICLLLLMCSACVPHRPLPQWKADRMQRDARMPCSGFHKGQRLGDGARVIRVHTSYIEIRSGDGTRVVVPCRAL